MTDMAYQRISEGQQLVEGDDLAGARRTLNQALAEANYDPTAYSDVISVFMLGRMYDDAEQAHLAYMEVKGKPLRADFSLEEIREERELQRPVAEGDKLTFRRLTLRQRGHFSNLFTFRPVTAIEITPATLTLWIRRREWRFPWTQVKIEIRKRKAVKAAGSKAFGHFQERTCTVHAGGRTFRFDVSDQYPDFAPPRQLIAEFQKHTVVEIAADDISSTTASM
jgi:hypothetical protein